VKQAPSLPTIFDLLKNKKRAESEVELQPSARF
jgi:hypothetical protein